MTVRGLSKADLHLALSSPALSSMNFLNDVAHRFPDAISFVPGRPYEGFFDIEDVHRYLRTYCRYLQLKQGHDVEHVRRQLLQYGRTKGIVHELIAEYLRVDEGIDVSGEAVIVTVGCQEALFIVLRALRATENDVVLAVSPCYVGLTGAARLLDMDVWPVRESDRGLDLHHLVAQVAAVRAAGKRPRALYIVPDFANPSGSSLDLDCRHRLLRIAEEHQILVLEDNPYGIFGGPDRLPTLKALDRSRQVIYLGSFAKTGIPGARVGFAIADQMVVEGGLLADELSKIKSMLTVNTSPIAQAVIGGKLLEHHFNLTGANQREIAVYRRNMRLLLDGLANHLPSRGNHHISWNTPSGGFFVMLDVPFVADDAALEYSARVRDVLWTPMRQFYSNPGGDHNIRLSCSALTEQQITVGVARLARFLTEYRTR